MNAFQLNDSASNGPTTSKTSSAQFAMVSGWVGRALQVLLLWAAYVRGKGAYQAWTDRESTAAITEEITEGESTGTATTEALLEVIRDPFWFEFSAAVLFVAVALIVVSDLRFVGPNADGVANVRDIRGAMRWFLLTPVGAAFVLTFFYELTLSESLSGFLFSRSIMVDVLPGWSGATLFPVIGMVLPAAVWVWSEIQMLFLRSGKPMGSGAPKSLVARASAVKSVESLGSRLGSLTQGQSSARSSKGPDPEPA